jgi:protein SCO1/2
MSKSTITAAAFAVAGALALSACGGSGSGQDKAASVSSPRHKKGATVLDQPFAKPDLKLTDTHGKKYDLAEETKGKPVLLYFGYTHCPDICPLTMSNIAIAKSKLTPAQQKALRVVFISSDPKDDTPDVLGKWLRGQDPSFIGLTGDFKTIQAGARSVGIGLDKPYKKKNGDVISTHGAQVLAFSPKDNKAHALYTVGSTKPEILEKDMPKLIKGETP